MIKHPTLFLTHRGLLHQRAALDAAPAELDVTIVRSPTKEQIIEMLPGKEFLITERTGVIDKEILQVGKDLRLIQRLGSQTHDIDLDAARAADIAVSYLPIQTCIMVAEHMLMQMLGVSKRIREIIDITLSAENFGKEPFHCDEDSFAYNWAGIEDIRGLWRSTVGILGMGEIGFELARRLRNFGCAVLYNKRNPLPSHSEHELNVQYAPAEELIARSDFLCVLLPLFKETAESLNREFFSKMKPDSCLISAGGSGIIDENALAEAISAGKFYGVAVDNFTWEPIRPDSPILEPARNPRSNVILSPHMAAGNVPASDAELRIDDYKNIVHWIRHEEIEFRLI